MKSVLICFAAFSIAAMAQKPGPSNRKGCVESKIVTRMPGCVILACEHHDFSSVDVPRKQNERGHSVEGETERTTYRCPQEKSPLELGRNTEQALKSAGYNILYTYVYGSGARFYMTAQKGGQWVKLSVVSDAYDLTAVKEKQMEQAMKADASGWAEEIKQNGRVTIYGINFDTGKATIRPDSEIPLSEIVKLFQANSSWEMAVAGHTDNVGAKEMNLTLSRQRGESVIAWLTAHGVAKDRMVPAGFGDTRPLAGNDTDEGRQKNRRVDLVRLY